MLVFSAGQQAPYSERVTGTGSLELSCVHDGVFALPRVHLVAAFVTPIGLHYSLLQSDFFLSNAIIEKSVLFFEMAIQYFYCVAVP